jgi:hypothetical protein
MTRTAHAMSRSWLDRRRLRGDPCTRSSKLPGRITFDVKHYSGDGLKLFKMQIGAEEEQRFEDARADFVKKHDGIHAPSGRILAVSAVKTESVTGGRLVYFDYTTDCSESAYPTVTLLGVGHTESTAINIEIRGTISAEVARVAASEVLAKFAKADLSALAQGR